MLRQFLFSFFTTEGDRQTDRQFRTCNLCRVGIQNVNHWFFYNGDVLIFFYDRQGLGASVLPIILAVLGDGEEW